MMRSLLCVCVLLFVVVATAQHTVFFEFALVFHGTCTGTDASFVCDLRAGNEELTTQIKPSGEVDFDVKHRLGSVAKMSLRGGVDANGQFHEVGNFTIGLSQTHRDHAVQFSGIGLTAGTLDPSSPLSCGSARYNVTGSTGQNFANARGPISGVGCTVFGTTDGTRMLFSGTVGVEVGSEADVPPYALLRKAK